MQNFGIKKEIWIWVMLLLPALYLCYVWPAMPAVVPTHFGLDGRPNGWSQKSTLAVVIATVLIGSYCLFTIIPIVDPKGRLGAMGSKYFLFKFLIMLLISALSLFMIHSAITGSLGSKQAPFMLVGACFVVLGNFMQTFRPNYFIGIRTPWTLSSDIVWRKTHQLAGKLYLVAGLLLMVLPFLLPEGFEALFLAIVLIAVVVPMACSFIIYRQQKDAAV